MSQRLTAQQQRELVITAEAGDADARRRLVEVFLPAIVALATQLYGGIGLDRQELVQEGVAGLLFAAGRYDGALETPFWAYAVFWVRKGMQELVAELTRPVALSDRAVRGLAGIRQARSEHVRAHGTEPTTQQLSDAIGLTPAQIESLQAAERAPRGLQEPMTPGHGTERTVGDTIVDPQAELAYERILDRIEIDEVRDLTARLHEREQTILASHYGLGGPPKTLTEIGRALGLTAERTRQIEVGALHQLREALTRPAVFAENPA